MRPTITTSVGLGSALSGRLPPPWFSEMRSEVAFRYRQQSVHQATPTAMKVQPMTLIAANIRHSATEKSVYVVTPRNGLIAKSDQTSAIIDRATVITGRNNSTLNVPRAP